MVNITKEQALTTGQKLGVDFKVVPLDIWHYAMNVELEHGTEFGLTNVSDNDLMITSKIALAHLLEFPDYYQRLKVMEEEGDADWEGEEKRVLIAGYSPETSRVYNWCDILILLAFLYILYRCWTK